jgi:hypothetical protein
LLIFNSASAQDVTGQWKGVFTNETTTKKTVASYSYVVELKRKGNYWEGTSYSYYTENGKKYYSICSVVAKKKSGTNSIEIWETKRTKTNNSSSYTGLQHHKLVYKKSGNKELLIGSWDHIYDKDVNTGAGKTTLERNLQQQTLTQISKAVEKRKLDLAKAKSLKENISKMHYANGAPDSSNNSYSGLISPKTFIEVQKKSSSLSDIAIPDKVGSYINYASRKKNVIRTIYTSSSSLIIDIYDNGEIDGDSITVLYNDKIMLFKQMLRVKPLSFTVDINQENEQGYELVMYAESLGKIPPNTALMIITDSKSRYEVRVSSDLQQSGVIKFIPQKSSQ